MGRVGYLDLLGRGLGRVVERGIKGRFRSTLWTTAISGRSCGDGYATESSCD